MNHEKETRRAPERGSSNTARKAKLDQGNRLRIQISQAKAFRGSITVMGRYEITVHDPRETTVQFYTGCSRFC